MRNILKKHKGKILLMIGLLFGGLIGVSADTIATLFSSKEVSFDNTSSEMSSTNVQDAIEELYNSCSFTSTTGKSRDPNTNDRIVYQGANPNNYICLASGSGACSANDLYRIIAIEENGEYKVIKNTSIGSIPWDPGYVYALTGITAANSTAGTRYSSNANDFCYVDPETEYYGCKSWGSKTSTYDSTGSTKVTTMPWNNGGTERNLPTYDSYLNVYLNGGTYPTTSGTTNITSWLSSQNSVIKNNIVENHKFNVGLVSNSSSIVTAENEEKNYIWKGNVGLMNATDYVKANSDSANCGTIYQSYANYEACKTTNWLFNSAYQWSISPSSGSYARNVWLAASSGQLNTANAHYSHGVRPVFYLSSDITLTGKGTNDSNVYRIQ